MYYYQLVLVSNIYQDLQSARQADLNAGICKEVEAPAKPSTCSCDEELVSPP